MSSGVDAGRVGNRSVGRIWDRSVELLRSPAAAWTALALLLGAAAVLIYHLTRGMTFWFDEWSWVLGRRGGGLDSLLRPHNEHLSLVPIAIYKLLFATAGIGSYVPWRVALIAGHLTCVLLVYVYARRRVGDYLALLGAALILFLGPGWQDILWGFQIGWMIPIAAGIGALLMLDRRDRLGDLAACVLIAVALASSGVGVAVALGAVVDVAWGRRRWRDWWIVGAPLLLYALWSIRYQHATLVHNAVFVTEHFVAGSAAASLSSLLGLSGMSVADEAGTNLAYGVPLALAGLAYLIWWTVRRGGVPARVASLGVIAVSFWLLTALNRSFISTPYTSRYLYVDCVFILLLAVEVARGTRVAWPAALGIGLLAVAAVVSNIGILRDGAAYLRVAAEDAKADLGALDIAAPHLAPGYVATSFPGYPFVVVRAGRYFATRRALGTPADSIAQLLAAQEPGREVADAELIRVDGVALSPVPAITPPAGTPALAVDAVAGGAAARDGACIRLTPSTVTTTGSDGALDVTVPPSGVNLTAGPAEVTVGARRFGARPQQIGVLRAGESAAVRLAPDSARQQWHLQVLSAGRTVVCPLRGPR